MRKIITVITVLVLTMTLSGCKEVPSFMPSYWDGLTKTGARDYILDTLQDKYGEEFVVKKMYLEGGTWNTSADLMANCSPKSHEEIVFTIQALAIGDSRVLRDTCVQSIVRKEMKNNIDTVLTKYYDVFATEVEVHGLSDSYDSGICKIEDATIKKYSEALPNTNRTHIWIVLNEKEINSQEKINTIAEEFTTDFYLTYAYIDFYYATDEIIKQCITEINSLPDRLV